MGNCGSAAAPAAVAVGASDLKALGELIESKRFDKRYRGQLAPTYPSAEDLAAKKTREGPVAIVCGGSVLVQCGPFGSTWLRQSKTSPPATQTLINVACELERLIKQKDDKAKTGVLYICMVEEHTTGLGVLKENGFDFYHFRDDAARVGMQWQRVDSKPEGTEINNNDLSTALRSLVKKGKDLELTQEALTTFKLEYSTLPKDAFVKVDDAYLQVVPTAEPELVYKKWIGSVEPQVPSYATSIEGSSALLFSPATGDDPDGPGDMVLLTWQSSSWRSLSGAVEPGELKLRTLARELKEEMGLELDQTFAPLYIGGWQASRARDGAINDNFSMFAVRSTTEDFVEDGLEIRLAAWFYWRPLLDIWRNQGGPCAGKLVIGEDDFRKIYAGRGGAQASDQAVQDQEADKALAHGRQLSKKGQELHFSNTVLQGLNNFLGREDGNGGHETRALEVREDVDNGVVTLFIGTGMFVGKSPLTFIVDCGSRHTKIHVLQAGRLPGTCHELRTFELRRPGKNQPLSLSDHVLKPYAEAANAATGETPSGGDASFDAFFTSLRIGLTKAGRHTGDRSTVFVGATGGVRKLLDKKSITQAQLDTFAEQLEKAVPQSEWKLLDGQLEAEAEYAASRFLFSEMWSAKDKGDVHFFSGGGATCQFAMHGVDGELYSIDLATKDAEQQLRDKKDPSEVSRHLEATFKREKAAKNLPMMHGTFLGIAMHYDCAELGFREEFLTIETAIARIDAVVEDLHKQTGKGWQAALDKWPDREGTDERARKNWPIGAAAALRLRAILAHTFAPEAVVYFGDRAKAEGLAVTWPVGMKLLLDRKREKAEAEVEDKQRTRSDRDKSEQDARETSDGKVNGEEILNVSVGNDAATSVTA